MGSADPVHGIRGPGTWGPRTRYKRAPQARVKGAPQARVKGAPQARVKRATLGLIGYYCLYCSRITVDGGFLPTFCMYFGAFISLRFKCKYSLFDFLHALFYWLNNCIDRIGNCCWYGCLESCLNNSRQT